MDVSDANEKNRRRGLLFPAATDRPKPRAWYKPSSHRLQFRSPTSLIFTAGALRDHTHAHILTNTGAKDRPYHIIVFILYNIIYPENIINVLRIVTVNDYVNIILYI